MAKHDREPNSHCVRLSNVKEFVLVTQFLAKLMEGTTAAILATLAHQILSEKTKVFLTEYKFKLSFQSF